MPKLSSADTPPEKSSDCLPVSTIAESGVITRMPLVCMSIVASAFQYGCAPTLMPATTMLISPPSWVNSTIRLSAAATQSMFSVPDSMEIRAPADSAYHSSGTRIRSARSSAAITRRHSGSDSAPSDFVGSPSSTTLVTPCGCRRVGVVTTPATIAACSAPSAGPPAPARGRRRGRARRSPPSRPGQLVRVDRVAAARAQHLLPVVVERLDRLVRRLADGQRGAAGGVEGDRARRSWSARRSSGRAAAR